MATDLDRIALTRLRRDGQRYTDNRRQPVELLVQADSPLTIPEILARRPDLAHAGDTRRSSVRRMSRPRGLSFDAMAVALLFVVVTVGAALTVATSLAHAGHPALAAMIHNAASSAFFDGFHASDYVSAGIAAAGALMALALLPAHPTAGSDDTPNVRALSTPAAAAARS